MRLRPFCRALLSALALLSSACTEPADPETALRRVVAELIDAVERKDPDTVLERLSVGFRSEPTERQQALDYPAAQSIVLEFLLREHSVGARAVGVAVEPGADSGHRRVRAEVWFARDVSLRDPAVPLPPGAVRYAFDLTFTQEAGVWKAIGGSFDRLGGL